ncbi:hypothetical protein FACS1894219_00960 [Clostridia bacterium]|nr:hypothetical protein FACS1894219_00960 [Clostridia bacterium]
MTDLFPHKLPPIIKTLIWGSETWFEATPLLIKFIDAKQDLSVQVHPDDEYAALHENKPGKTEMWYIVDSAPGAKIAAGLTNAFTREEVRHAVEAGTLETMLNYIEVNPGDVFLITPGTIHAIGAGILLAEIQVNSDVTYRLYDYNRVGADGKHRELHVEKSLDVYKQTIIPPSAIKKSDAFILGCEYFQVQKAFLTVSTGVYSIDSESAVSVLCVEGCGNISHNSSAYAFRSGDCYLIPAGTGKIVLTGNAELLIAINK